MNLLQNQSKMRCKAYVTNKTQTDHFRECVALANKSVGLKNISYINYRTMNFRIPKTMMNIRF